MANKKDTIYIAVDDEITSIIDKVQASKEAIVALVLPKRAGTLQSIVNMKLLHKAADDSGKRVVLITSEQTILPLAGAVGLYVAKNLQSKPVVPPGPDTSSKDDDVVEIDDSPVDATKTVGELAGAAAVGASVDDDVVEIDNDSPSDTDAIKKVGKKAKKDKKLKVPNFNSFRAKLFLGLGVLLLLIVGWYVAFFVVPKATIAIKTDTTTSDTSVQFTTGTNIKEFNQEERQVPAQSKEVKKTETEKVPATGQKDLGSKATGSVTFTNCDKDDETITVPSGTGISSGNLTYITQQSATIPASNFTGGGVCKNDSTKTVDVIAQANGEQYNTGAKQYTISGNFGTALTASGSDMTGGSSKIAKVVSEQDVQTAKDKLSDKKPQYADELAIQLEQSGQYAIKQTMFCTEPAVKTSPEVGQEATEVTVTSVTICTMLGVKETDLNTLLESSIKESNDLNQRSILDTGLKNANFNVGAPQKPPANQQVTVQTTATIGSQLDANQIKQDVSGKKKGEAENIIKQLPGVKEVKITYSPFWVSKAPKPSKITVNFENAN